MYWRLLDKVDSNLYKGIAILMIVTHNFMHLFPKPKENEFSFSLERTLDFIYLISDSPESILRVLASFLGHFGVQIFVFLSAYGLTKKHLLAKISYWPFIRQRIIKIYPAFILAILAWVIVEGWIKTGGELLGPLKILYWGLDGVLLKLTLLSNFIPGQALNPVGPWWFIPFIFQFYIIFPFLLFCFTKWNTLALVMITSCSIILSTLLSGKIGELNIYYTVIGHLPEFCLGIYLASNDKIKINPLILILSLALFILGNFYEVFWYVNHISFLILLLALFSYITPLIKSNYILKNILLFLGALSMELFLVNAFLRTPFIDWAMASNSELMAIVLCTLSFFASIFVALILSKSEKLLIKKLFPKK
ncbi:MULTISPECIES: acyltransferase [unclassified Colwellia]|uniref:acyltransferase family protein n=2 Tax=Colwellia TaxID=28228 RepID=UPI0015F60740|nr:MULTISPECIES: acyltransferase [unclassified Colwellia]MBA6357448.1 acyltransferase [Colwellia sp. BRX8-3]MBA6369153.1 acyltransferase [Colwellia sp. BRX8-5]MBA6374900.1 acyltransferase [Colwellia sp. BRX8-2]